jgi:hypothetical protein
MFKRSGAIVLTMLYLVTAMGFAINLRYCGKVITAVKINAPVKSCNSNLASSKMKCCTEKQIDIKIKDSHVGEFPTFLGKLFSFHIAKLPFANVVFNIPVTATQATIGRAPPNQPLANNVPVFIKNCTFRI